MGGGLVSSRDFVRKFGRGMRPRAARGQVKLYGRSRISQATDAASSAAHVVIARKSNAVGLFNRLLSILPACVEEFVNIFRVWQIPVSQKGEDFSEIAGSFA